MSQASFQSGVQLHQAGQLEQAEAIYRQVLSENPGHTHAIDLLGVIHAQRKQFKPAIALFQQAIALQPAVAEYYLHIGQAMIDSGQPVPAIPCYRQAAALQPANHAAIFKLSILLAQNGQLLAGIDAAKAAVALEPGSVDYRGTLATMLMRANRPDLAAVELREITQRQPENIHGWHNLGAALCESGKVLEGLDAFHEALKLNPNHAVIYSNMAGALRQLGRTDEALAAARRAIEIDPDVPGGQNNLGAILSDVGDFEGTLAAWRIAVRQDPASPGIHWNLARILLQLGHFEEGWEEFEWRLQFPGMKLNRNFPQPQWDGSDPSGKTILLHAEGGFGDALNFIRLVPQVVSRGGRWILECQPELTRLFAGTAGVERIIARGETLPAFDAHMPLQGLPRIVRIRLDNIPREVPYLQAPPDRADFWGERVAGREGLRVGLVWAGSKGQIGDTRTRNVNLFAPLAGVPGVRFFSLQQGPDGGQKPPAGMDWTDYTEELFDFAETAALVQNLDLVISVDTSVAHLAGALARAVWVVIPFQCDFRWLTHRTDSPWYPTMRLFRQPSMHDWATPISQIEAALRQRATPRE
jgi:tetratricopeptide (TPR) repeat protein